MQPKTDKDSLENFGREYPRIIVNPRPTPFGFKGIEVPKEALPVIELDDSEVKDIDPKPWAVCGTL